MRELIAAHFREHLGAEETVTSANTVEVMVWADPTDAETVILATVGMCSVPMKIGTGQSCVSSEPRVELLMYTPRREATAASLLLRDLARYPIEHGTFVHWSHVVRLGRPLVPGSALTALYFSFPPIESAGFATMKVEGKRVDVLWVVPISDDERKVFDAAGADALEELLEARGALVSDLRRT